MNFFGFQKGKIELKIAKFSFASGETIEGTLVLTLKKQFLAKELAVQLIGEQSHYDAHSHHKSYRRIYEFSQSIDGEKEYPAQPLEYDFKISAPQNPNANLPEGALGSVIKAAQLFTGGAGQIRWFLIGRLAVAGFDITKKIQISIS